jgi:DNA-binding NtrC family response regulator
MTKRLVLLVDDDDTLRRVLTKEIEAFGYAVRSLPDADGVEEVLKTSAPDVALVDLRLPGMTGMELLARLRSWDEDLPVVMLTGHGSVPEAVQAIRLGAYDFLAKPTSLDQLEQVLGRACERHDLAMRVRGLTRLAAGDDGEETEGVGRIRGTTPEIEALREQIRRVAPAEASVLIQGESGTGKELVARAIHAESPRAGQAFVVIHCGAIPDGLVESELFGHERGAFTGAYRRRPGLLEAAAGGTLFLDEVGELPLTVQPALLRVLQFGEIRPVGSQRTRHVDVRILSATHRDLEQEIEEGRFREDLYYRLSPIILQVPPLRERRDDIPLLARHFLEQDAPDGAHELGAAAEAALRALDWPGNVRELENAMIRLRTLARSARIGAQDVQDLVARRRKMRGESLPTLCLDDLERLAVLEAMKRHGGDKRTAAAELGIALKTLYNKLARYG